ncbi:DUF6455 family protein [Bradyrhizobium sp. dw_78]|uniref:DUF6455 family protein n=1 Tax=Bradyrhizobium sp. dw_78 TaxID=2719793 RepID=UPI001BD44196|nr:DUF6455 family protein [Bradyrhizobium sp. dw_78]
MFWDLLRRARQAISHRDEIGHLSLDEIEGIARDVHVSTPEFVSLATGASVSTALLDRRLARSGLSESISAARRGEVLRDLQRVCGQCRARNRCTADLASGGQLKEQPEYCPNALTLRALMRESTRHSAA